MIATSIDNIEDEKLRPYSWPSSFIDHITILHYYSIKLKSFMLNIIATSMIASIVAAFALFTFSRNLQLDASCPDMPMLSIKNSLSVAATVYPTDCVARMVMDAVPQEVKEEYLEPMFNCLFVTIAYGAESLTKISNIIGYFNPQDEL